MIKEACVENFTLIPQFIASGINRIELCDNLAVGGTTPSSGVMKQAQAFCQKYHIPIMAIIRPRGGDFVYNETEIQIMLYDINIVKQQGLSGVVLGAITVEGRLDEMTMERLIKEAAGLDITFHMAFDALNEIQKYEAIDWLASHGVGRILTHGGATQIPISKTLDKLQQYITYADERIIIMPGGGITYQNADMVIEQLQVEEIHGTNIIKI